MMKKKILLIPISAIILGTMFTTTVQAALQSRPGVKSLTGKEANYFFEEIRKMEAEGGTLGKNANIDMSENGSYLDSSNNGLDVHMAKNTEWGTAAMLSASAYGEAPTGRSDASTTGNATGIYQMADGTYEYVTGIYNTSYQYMSKIKEADGRYRDEYTGTGTTFAKAGDATKLERWKGASHSTFVHPGYPVFSRSITALFGYSNSYGTSLNGTGTRAVVVLGGGL